MIRILLPIAALLGLAVPAWSAPIAGGGAGGSANADHAVTLLIIFVALALLVSFLCSVAEAVLLSITPSYVAGLQEKQPERAARIRRLRLDQVDRSLAAILTMNTIAHTVGAIGAGAQAGVVFGSASVGVFSAVMTLLILFFSEIIPKTLGAVFWRQLVPATSLYIRTLVFLLYPLVVASEAVTRLIARDKDLHSVSREEFVAMAGMGAKSGAIDPYESTFIRNLFRFSALTAADIMTPRPVVSALPEALTIAEARESVKQGPFSRLPIYGRDIDDVTGLVLKDEVLALASDGQDDRTLASIKREIPAVPASIGLPKLFDFLLNQRRHIAVAVGEYGATRGIVTLEDVIETLLGMEIVDEMDSVADMRHYARQEWAQRARALGIDIEDGTTEAAGKGGG